MLSARHKNLYLRWTRKDFFSTSASCRRELGKFPTPWRNDSVLVEENYARHTIFALDFFKRFIKYTAIGLVVTGVTTLTAYEAAHMYVEHVALAPETDEEVRKWQWDLEADKWTGGE